MALSKHLYDFSNYTNDHFIYSEENQGKLGTFKDECQSKPIEELVALRAKMYAFVLADKAETVTMVISECLYVHMTKNVQSPNDNVYLQTRKVRSSKF
jgi:hypothetical protein